MAKPPREMRLHHAKEAEVLWNVYMSALASNHNCLRAGSNLILLSHHFSCKVAAPAWNSFGDGQVVVH